MAEHALFIDNVSGGLNVRLQRGSAAGEQLRGGECGAAGE